MLRNFRLMVVFPLLLPSLCLADFSGRVVRVVDGDTVQVLADGKMQKVRLNGIDAPESGQPFGQRSKQNLLNWPHRNKRKLSPVAQIAMVAGWER